MSLLALPSTREEGWRWSSLAELPALAEAAPKRARHHNLDELWLGCGGPRLVFVDGRFDADASDPSPVALGPVEADAEGHPLARLAEGQAGWTLTLGRGQAPAHTIEIIHIATGGACHLPARIALGEDAQASVVESFVGDGWANRLTMIELGRSARLMRSLRLTQDTGFVSLREVARVGQGASLVTVALVTGGA
ncbi:MAG: SufD family Fe-S cluster assembly protein, partial [Sphingomonadaceae bacterium]|nr:SufD family Fe-S cluster assembly protein [Sphingomonadaceae bacterium]